MSFAKEYSKTTEKRRSYLDNFNSHTKEFTVSDFIATLNYHSHVEADDYGHSLTPPLRTAELRVSNQQRDLKPRYMTM